MGNRGLAYRGPGRRHHPVAATPSARLSGPMCRLIAGSPLGRAAAHLHYYWTNFHPDLGWWFHGVQPVEAVKSGGESPDSQLPAVLVSKQRNSRRWRIVRRGPFGAFPFWSVGRHRNASASGQSARDGPGDARSRGPVRSAERSAVVVARGSWLGPKPVVSPAVAIAPVSTHTKDSGLVRDLIHLRSCWMPARRASDHVIRGPQRWHGKESLSRPQEARIRIGAARCRMGGEEGSWGHARRSGCGSQQMIVCSACTVLLPP